MKRFLLTLIIVSLVWFELGQLAPIGVADNPQKEEATPVEIGVMTEKQREHSKLFLFLSYKGRKKLVELTETGTGDIEIIGGHATPFGFAPLSEEGSKVYPNPYLRGIASDADAVIIGTVKDRASQITEDERFVFTDYEILVEETLKPNSQAPPAIIDQITVTRLGGTVQLRGRAIRARDLSFNPFKVRSRYLLFLKYIPATASYRAFTNGSFLLEDDRATKLANGLLWPAMEQGVKLEPFLTEVRDAIISAGFDEINGTISRFRLY